MEEIIEHVYYEIKNSGFEKKLVAGIVITGGGAQLRHIVQLVEFITGMDTRIGYPNEHLAKGADELKSPMYATSVGLVIKGFLEMEKKKLAQKKLRDKVEFEKKGKSDKLVPPSRTGGGFFDAIKKIFEEEPDNELK